MGVLLGGRQIGRWPVGVAAVAVEPLTVDPGALVGQQELHEVGGVLRGAEPARRLLGQTSSADGVVDPPGVDRPGVDDVGPQTPVTQFVCGRQHKAVQGALGHAVGQVPQVWSLGQGKNRPAVRTELLGEGGDQQPRCTDVNRVVPVEGTAAVEAAGQDATAYTCPSKQ